MFLSVGFDTLLIVIGVIGTIAFAISGALIAIENKLDLFGVVILGVTTACFGGMVRDVMLKKEIAIFVTPYYPLIAVITALIVFVIMYFLKKLSWENSKIYKTVFNIVDSIGLGAFVVTGADVAINAGVDEMFPIIFYSVLTAVGGGLMRDIVVCKIPAIFRKHIYAIASIIDAIVYYVLYKVGSPYQITCIVTVVLIIIIRFCAYKFEWSLPKVHLKEEKQE